MSNPGSSAGARPEGGDDSRGPGGRGGDPPAPDAGSTGGGPGVGAAAAAIVVTKVGCAPAMPDLDEVLDFMKNNNISKGER